MPQKTNEITCAFCGEIKPSEEYADRVHGKAPYCIECEKKIFNRIKSESGLHLALYACCAAFNLPFLPLIAAKDIKGIEKAEDGWQLYQNLIDKAGFYEKNGKILTFFDGGTNILRLFGRQLDDKTTAQYIEAETSKIGSMQGTPEQRARWGTVELMKNLPMTREIYDTLDGMYDARAAEYKGTVLSAQQQDVLIKVCKWNYMIDMLVQKGMYPYAEKLQKMVQSELAAECMRKQDEKPTEAIRLDATVDALEKAGLMEDGSFLTYEETMAAFAKWFTGENGMKNYDYSEDVCNQMILSMQNAARANADMALLTELPEDLMIHDTFGECEPEETETEKAAKQYAGLTPITPPKKRKGESE